MPHRTPKNARQARLGRPMGIALMLCLFVVPRLSPAIDPLALRASYVLSLSKFVEWPIGAGLDTDPFTICVQGDEIINALSEHMRGKQTKGRKVVVSSLSSHPQGHNCQLLYVHSSELWRISTIMAEVAGRPILTIGDGAPFAVSGGMIELKPEGGRLVFEINLAAAERVGLKLSSQILELAKQIVR